MASISKYKSAKGIRWRVQYTAPDGRRTAKKGFLRKEDAQLWAADNTLSMQRGTWIAPSAQRITVEELGERWIKIQSHLKPSTRELYRQVWSSAVKPYWGGYKVSAISSAMVQEWVSGSDYSASWTRHAHNVLSQVLQMAVDDRKLIENPARGVKLPRRSKGVNVYLTMDQLKLLARNAGDREDLVLLLGTTGLRWGEAIALRPMDIDFKRGRIHVSRNAAKVGNRVVLGTPKTHSERSVAVARFVLDKLFARGVSKAPGDLLWRGARGGWLMAPGHDSWFDSAVKRSQLEDPSFPRVTAHGLRHVAAGLLVQSGANVKLVSAQLGHASTSETLNRYAGLFDDGLDEVAAVMDASFSGVSQE